METEMKKWLRSLFLKRKEKDELAEDPGKTENMDSESVPPEEQEETETDTEKPDSESVPPEEPEEKETDTEKPDSEYVPPEEPEETETDTEKPDSESVSPEEPEEKETDTDNSVDSIPVEDAEQKHQKVLLFKNKFPKEKKPKKPWSVKKKVIVFSCLGVFAALLITVGVWVITITSDPLAVLANDKPATTTTQQSAEGSPANGEATPEATPDPEDVLLSQADMTFLDTNYVNIMLIGVDHSTERDDWKGKDDFHSDVMIVLTINRTTNEVSMISLPRDTYAKIPGVEGIYKLNAAINCGGGWCEEGFEKVCQAAQWMLGGSGGEDDPIKIDKYFAVDMNAVKGLVDAIGGVDYDLDISFDNAGREYTKGFQHMNGQAVLDYLRVRKAEHIVEKNQDSDKKRVERQRKMLVEIFKKIKNNGLLASIPSMITAFEGNLEYNLNFSEISALAYYAISVDPETIKSYSMSGDYVLVIKHADDPFAFTFTDQAKRVKIIKEVYGVTVKKRSGYKLNDLRLRWGALEAKQFANAAESAISKAKKIMEADAAKPNKPTLSERKLEGESGDTSSAPPETSSEPPATSDSPVTSESPVPSESTTPTTTPEPAPTVPPGGYRQYDENSAVWALYNKVMAEYEMVLNYDSYDDGEELLALLEQFKEDVISLCDMLGISQPSSGSWVYDFQRKYNEVYVDLR
jgi:polyisoprenyl-teichoic acid--peptidoglycan teichoic acid transferase